MKGVDIRMNREQKRSLKKSIKSGKVRIDKVRNALLDVLTNGASTYGIEQGDKVRLNYEKLISDPNYDKMNEEWKDWIEKHKNVILSVKFDEKHAVNKLFCGFDEDDSGKNWLFFVGDLIKIENI